MAKIIVIQNAKEQMLGFLMFSGQASPFTPQDWQGKCLFAGSPMEADAADDPVGQFLQPYKNKPKAATLTHIDNQVVIEVEGLLRATLNNQWKGEWQSTADESMGGKCHVPDIPEQTQH